MKKKVVTLLEKYCTARIDIKNIGSSDNDILILKKSDRKCKIYQPEWLNGDDGKCTVIESLAGSLDLKLKCIKSGQLQIWFKGLDYKDKNNNRFPIFIDFTSVKINNQKIFEKNIVVSHDDNQIYKKEIKDDEVISLHIEWLPFNNESEYNTESTCKSKLKEIESLKEKLSIREEQLKSIPQLSCTSLGKTALGGKLIYRNWLGLTPERTVLNDLNGFCEHHWFTNYFKHKFPDDDYKIGIFGVANPHDNLKYPMEEKKFLYAPEDLNYRYLEMKMHFDKYALDYVDLAMGYDIIDNPKYIRFPYWLIWHFPPTVTEEQIENKVNLWNSSSFGKTKDIASIASHDLWGVRTLIDNDINNIVNIEYAGKWKNNTSELWEKFNNNKQSYLRQFKFNLCPENIIADAYVTEKIFDAIHCDCIPLYAGGGNYLEPEVINPKAVIRWDADDTNVIETTERKHLAYYGHPVHSVGKWTVPDDRNKDSIELFKNLLTDKKSYKEFKDQDKVLDSTTKFIINKFSELEKQFERLIYS